MKPLLILSRKFRYKDHYLSTQVRYKDQYLLVLKVVVLYLNLHNVNSYTYMYCVISFPSRRVLFLKFGEVHVI